MLLWFALIGVLIVFIFWLIEKMSDAFDRQERKFYDDLQDHWYEERDKLIERENGN